MLNLPQARVPADRELTLDTCLGSLSDQPRWMLPPRFYLALYALYVIAVIATTAHAAARVWGLL